MGDEGDAGIINASLISCSANGYIVVQFTKTENAGGEFSPKILNHACTYEIHPG